MEIVYKNIQEVYMAAFGLSRKEADKMVDCMNKEKRYKKIKTRKKYMNKVVKILKKHEVV